MLLGDADRIEFWIITLPSLPSLLSLPGATSKVAGEVTLLLTTLSICPKFLLLLPGGSGGSPADDDDDDDDDKSVVMLLRAFSICGRCNSNSLTFTWISVSNSALLADVRDRSSSRSLAALARTSSLSGRGGIYERGVLAPGRAEKFMPMLPMLPMLPMVPFTSNADADEAWLQQCKQVHVTLHGIEA